MEKIPENLDSDPNENDLDIKIEGLPSLSKEEFEKLRDKFQTLSPEKQEKYQEIQEKACGEFIRQFRDFLNEDQISYMSADNILIVDPDKLDLLEEELEEAGVNQISETTTLNGKQYIKYEVIGPEFLNKNNEDEGGSSKDFDVARHFWSGRVAVVPLLRTFEEHNLNSSLLVTEEEYEEVICEGDLSRIFANLEDFVPTYVWASMALHEKIHGIQKHDLPLPILEIVACYYQDKTFENVGWESKPTDAFEDAIAYWDKLVEEIGDDLHKFVFDNLPTERSEEIRKILISRFNEETMNSLFNKGDLYRTVKWFTEEDLN